MSEDRHLMKGLRHGDNEALRRLYEKYKADLYTVALSLLHDIHASEDCLQDVFVTLADIPANFTVRRNLKHYLISCVANRARDRLRKKQRQVNYQLEEPSSSARLNDPAKELIDCEESLRLYRALAELPYEQREAFVLHAEGQIKFREIAKWQNVSIKTAQSRYRYAVEKLRELLK